MILLRILCVALLVFSCSGHPNGQDNTNSATKRTKLTVEEILRQGMREFVFPRVITLEDFPVYNRKRVKEAMEEAGLKFVVEGDFKGDGTQSIVVVGREGSECVTPAEASFNVPTSEARTENGLCRRFISIFSVRNDGTVIRESFVSELSIVQKVGWQWREENKEMIQKVIQKARKDYYDLKGNLAGISLSTHGVLVVFDVGFEHANITHFYWNEELGIFFESIPG